MLKKIMFKNTILSDEIIYLHSVKNTISLKIQ